LRIPFQQHTGKEPPGNKEGKIMLVLSRKRGERVIVGEIELTVLAVRGDRVKLGFAGPREIPIHREEIHQDIYCTREALCPAEY